MYKTVDGVFQEREGRRMMDGLERPEYQTPNEIEEVLSLAKQMATGPMPGIGMAESRMDAQLGNLAYDAMSTTSSSADALSALVSGYGQNTVARQGLAVESARDRREQQKFLVEALKLRASYRDAEFQDRFGRYADDANAAMGLMQAGRTNVYSGIEGIGRVVGQGAMAKGIMSGDGGGGDDAVLSALFNSGGAMDSGGGQSDPNSGISPELMQILLEYQSKG